MQMRKREMSPCRVPCHPGRIDPADVVVVGVRGDEVEAGAAVVGEVVAEEHGPSLGGMSQTWGEGQKNCGDKFDPASAESTGRRRRHGTLRSARLEHGDPGG
jgi:hypothetical protein